MAWAEAGDFDVIVVGTGHAGCEAGLAAARMGCRTLLLTTNLDNIALMACNPSIGGPAKGHLVREIDALGGEMAQVTDETALQVRVLNASKGPAVQAYRAQVDKRAYQAAMRRRLERQDRLWLRQGMVTDLLLEGGRVAGVVTRTNLLFRARAVVLTTGVYLESRVVTGAAAQQAGPSGQVAAQGLSACLLRLGFRIRRFKTGTSPRVARRSLDFSQMEQQPGSSEPLAFSFATDAEQLRGRPQLPCWLTRTTPATAALIRANLHRAPLYNGEISGKGPRYCPSIEDKVVRFAERAGHPVFVEPEGRDSEEMYLQGLSTSLPEELQAPLLQTVPGLERAEILRAGYAIEYDCLDPGQLYLSLESRLVPGLFAAGQINGSSGYEEAAAQGLLAGINAALRVQGREPLILSRSQAYIGVLVDDLVTKGVAEPYRLLTGRAEHRLLLRQGNADERLTEIGFRLGLASAGRLARMREKVAQIQAEVERLSRTYVLPRDANACLSLCGSSPLAGRASLADLLRRPEVSYAGLAPIDPDRPALRREVVEEVVVRIKYAGYLARQEAEVARLQRFEHLRLPADLRYEAVPGLSREGRERLSERRPETLGQAMRLEGVSAADASVLLVALEARRRAERGQRGA